MQLLSTKRSHSRVISYKKLSKQNLWHLGLPRMKLTLLPSSLKTSSPLKEEFNYVPFPLPGDGTYLTLAPTGATSLLFPSTGIARKGLFTNKTSQASPSLRLDPSLKQIFLTSSTSAVGRASFPIPLAYLLPFLHLQSPGLVKKSRELGARQ